MKINTSKIIYVLVAFYITSYISASNLSAQQTLTTWPTNSYQKVLDAADCGKKLYVSDASLLVADDWVLLVQTNGATAEDEECSRYGRVEKYGAAGNFELARVESVETQPVSGDDYVILKSCPSLFYYAAYNVPGLPSSGYPGSNDYGYQLVKVHYVDDDLTIDGNLNAPAWDNTAGTGGVIAIAATGTITLEADINVSEAGFPGGEPNLYDNSDVDQTAYELSITDKAGEKGEEILLGSSSLHGRGASANGGGGGGGRNAGGGGGSNYGSGGRGGDQNGAEDDPNTTADDENQKIGGEGGWPMAYNQNGRTQAFFGGGGGGGHRSAKGSDPDESKGGVGGGIVLILANRLEVNGSRTIDASGGDGYDAEPGDNGAGGGGGGGVVLLDVPTIASVAGSTGTLTVDVEGGDGGDTDDADCTGPGGGGGGGLVWFRTSTAPTVVTLNKDGGTKGSATNCSTSPHNATDGEDGGELFNLTYPKWYDENETPI